MAEPVKFTEDELKTVTKIREDYFNIQNEFGQIKLAKIRLETQIDSVEKREEELHKQFTELQNSETEFLDSITEKYGQGTLNPETGEFIPNK